MENDLILVKQTQKGDEKAFTSLYQKYIKLIYGYVYNKTQKQAEAEDITSEVWLSALKSIKQFKAQSSFKNWLFGITKHKLMDYYREKYQLPKMPLIDNIYLKEEIIEDKENQINKLLANLPENYQKVLKLRFLKGYTSIEISKELKLSISNIKVIQHRAINKLKDQRLKYE